MEIELIEYCTVNRPIGPARVRIVHRGFKKGQFVAEIVSPYVERGNTEYFFLFDIQDKKIRENVRKWWKIEI